ncbi:MAG: hypothetical protein US31_C0020G0003 [Berkelbacteria bacterium GW2011_GWA1_36_9]|uniref:Uncharacterized protein n=1 Tax=Berkelbacteria bacterium GW2011_GWA1_36_9 TaxID=1618331 RepID=A0A0G0FDQ2_9BACT|nr:MAG: hypothetical protein US31_C0020G0003 [Berkelbacteria bacterium GW2011_GWA1_36_9]
MYLLVPANSKQLIERALWFKNPVARKLAQEKGVEFGFELKGEPETISPPAGGAPPLYWGYHLPGGFASEYYYHPEKRRQLISSVSHLVSLKPNYVNLHGIHLWRQPSAKKHLNRYVNRSESAEYLKVLEANIELIKKLQAILPQLTLENYPITSDFRGKDGKILPETYLFTGSGRLNDLLYLRKKTGVEILLDLEHLILTLNFLNRQKNYRHVPVNKSHKLNSDEEKIKEIFGFNIQKGQIPFANKEIILKDIVKKIGAKRYHITGSDQDVNPGKKILSHGPIEVGNKAFRKNIQLVLSQKPETILIEVANSINDTYYGSHLRPNETELSFCNLCEILLEEL